MKRKRKQPGFHVSPSHASQRRIFGETGAYLNGSLFHPHKNKWGVGDKIERRRAQIDKDVPGPVYTIFGRTIMFGWLCEQFVHWLYQLQNAPMETGTGRLEWYYTFSPLFGSAVLFTCFKFGVVLPVWVYILSFFPLWVWLDGLLWLIFFRLVGWLACAGMAWLIWKIVNS